jgi:hypothetical protein
MKKHGGFIPFDELTKMKRSKKKSTKKKSKHKKRNKKKCDCGDSQVIIEKGTGKRRCSKCTERGIIIRGEDDFLYILKKNISDNRWVKI